MLLNILLFLFCFLHLYADYIPDEHRWNIKYMSDTKGGKFDRVINGYDFDFDPNPYEEDVLLNVCYATSSYLEPMPLPNHAGYVFCTGKDKGIPQMCPPGTEDSYYIGGCINTTTQKTVFPIGSRCASQPCQNGGICYDFRSADAYLCRCAYSYKGLHCHLQLNPSSDCGGESRQFSIRIGVYTTDMALNFTCTCSDWNRRPLTARYAMNNCYTEKLFDLKCTEKSRVLALPFTNKGFYICPFRVEKGFIKSCPLHHVWNDTEKECVLENN